MTPDDVQRVAQAYVRPDRLSIVLVGNARAFVPQLRAVGFTDFEVIPIERARPDVGALRRERAGRGLGALSAAAARRFRRMPPRRAMRIMMSCGEPSGDLYAGALVERAARARAGRRDLRPRRRSLRQAGGAAASRTTAASRSPA